MRRCAVLFCVLALFLSGCTSIASPHAATATPTLPGPPATATCTPPTPILEGTVGPEAQGTVTSTSAGTASPQLWALLQPSVWPARADTYLKIVWRMTGNGSLSLVAVGPDGRHLAPHEGPTAHAGSNWDRPGDEWGSSFIFPVAGCWDLHASRDDVAGDIQLIVGPAYACPSPTTAPALLGGHEVQGTAHGAGSAAAQLWALFTADAWPPRANVPVTIDVRMTGAGALGIRALGPGGASVFPAADPVPHSSTWARPGDGYRATFTFPSAGCWDVQVFRSDVDGDVPLTVVSAS